MVDKKEEENEREVSEKEIDDHLDNIMNSDHIGDPSHVIKFLARILYNVRYDLNDLKLQLIKTFKEEEEIERPEREEYDIYK